MQPYRVIVATEEKFQKYGEKSPLKLTLNGYINNNVENQYIFVSIPYILKLVRNILNI